MSALPTLLAYLDGLPAGLASYPETVVKASIVRTFLANTDGPVGWADELPAFLPQLVRDPPLASAWLPEVSLQALGLAARDQLFPTDQAYIAHWRRVNDAVINGRLYRAVFALASPARVLSSTAARWGHLHRGVELSTDTTPHRATARMKYPRALVTELGASTYVTAFESVLSASGGRNVKVTVQDYTPTHATFDARWR